jgi:hypothetical protein
MVYIYYTRLRMGVRRLVGMNLWRLRAAAGLSQNELIARTGSIGHTFLELKMAGVTGRRSYLNETAMQLGGDVRELLNPSGATE